MKKGLLFLVLAIVIVLLAWLLLGKGTPVGAPADTTANVPDGPVPFEVLEEGANAATVTEGKNYRIQSEEQLAALWELIYGTEGAPAMPAVDFSKEEILAVFSGQKKSGGYDVSIKEVMQKNGMRVVTIVHEAPGDGCSMTDALTSPFELIRVPVGTDNLTHQDEEVVESCS